MRRHAAARRTTRAPQVVALVLVGLVTFGATAVATQYVRLDGALQGTEDFTALVGPPVVAPTPADPEDPGAGRARTVLVMATDDRSGENEALGGYVAGARSDTTLLVHVSADRSRVDVVSIARDTRADIPACNLTTTPGEKLTQPVTTKFNAAFERGASAATGDRTTDLLLAASCTIYTLQEMTGVQVDDFVVVDFAGFRDMVDAVGGIDLTVPEAVRPYKHNTLALDAGPHHMDGQLALEYARVRYGVGDNSDTQRQPRQQSVVAAVAEKVMSPAVLGDPISLSRFLQASTASLTLSPGLDSIKEITGLGWSLRSVDRAAITFAMVPAGAGDDGTVVWTPEADLLWEAIRTDQPITEISTATPFAQARG